MSTHENESSQNNIIDEISFDIPPDCRVRFFNDDYTTKEFVVSVLKTIFHKSDAEAFDLMEKVHQSGSAIVGVYTYDIAMTRSEITMQAARNEGFPLRVVVEV